MYHLNIEGLQSAVTPDLDTVHVHDARTDDLLFTGSQEEADLFAEVCGIDDLEFTTIQDFTRGFA